MNSSPRRGDSIPLAQMASFGDVAGQRVESRFRQPRVGDIVHSHADITLARDAMGCEPVVSLHEGIARTVASYRDETARRARHPDRSSGPGA